MRLLSESLDSAYRELFLVIGATSLTVCRPRSLMSTSGIHSQRWVEL